MNEEVYELFTRARAFLADGHPGQAALLLERASALEPDKGSIWEALGRAHFGMSRYPEAVVAFEEALRVEPSNDYAHYALAVSLETMGKLSQAQAHIRMATVMCPENSDYEVAHARIRIRGGAEGRAE